MSIESDRECLSQNHNLKRIRHDLKTTELLTVYQWPPKKEGYRDYFFLCALIPRDQIEQVLSERNISSGDPERMGGMPAAFDDYTKEDEKQVKYLRYGTREGFEPLIISRSFGGIRESYNEISEEFRHFHDLYHNRKTDTYIKTDEDGNERTVAIVKPNEIQIRLQEIRQFLAIKEMYLSMLFEFNEYSKYTLQELGLNELKPEFRRDDLMFWRRDYCGKTPYERFQSDSRLRGRRLIKPLPKSKSGFGDFAEEPKYVEFIVDVDENGDKVYHTCDPYKLSGGLGENSDSASRYTIVHFRKQVLDKYYNEPNKYGVRDSMVCCGSLWSMRIDNHDRDKVCVFLDDLGMLPYTEQCHWSQPQYNIPPEGGVSETFYRRMIQGEWASSDQPDHLFQQSYEQLQKACKECLGWQLLKPFGPGDEYRLKRLRIPTANEESHFKDLVSDLTSILIEALNEECLKNLIPNDQRKDIKRGIGRLEYILNSQEIAETEKHITFLRCLWDLRTTRSSSHLEILEDKRYQRAAKHFDLENRNRQEAFAKILEGAVQFLDFLSSVVQSGKLSDKNDASC
ncbi:hypothetical protein F4054_12240 [Candidatus Poribacteria bacterium]|nr:hypothetical protein [Candidatus Poribacteria bacterium]MYK23012.1 hypothetical protein [Candidatus Poribacteria bacterium]